MFDDLFPVEVAVLGVDDDPVKSESHGHFGDTRAFQGHPQAISRRLLSQPVTKSADSVGLHGGPLWGRGWRLSSARKNLPGPFDDFRHCCYHDLLHANREPGALLV